jgi:hypothetical protein
VIDRPDEIARDGADDEDREHDGVLPRADQKEETNELPQIHDTVIPLVANPCPYRAGRVLQTAVEARNRSLEPSWKLAGFRHAEHQLR